MCTRNLPKYLLEEYLLRLNILIIEVQKWQCCVKTRHVMFCVVDIMNDTDESTAVFNIRRFYNEFASGMSGSSLASKLSFEG